MLVLLSYLEERERDAAAESTQAFAHVAANHVAQFLNTRVRALENLADRIEPDEFGRRPFIAEVERLDAALPGFRAINWIDAQGTIRWVFPHVPNVSALGRNVFDHPRASSSLRESSEFGVVAVTPPLMLFQGEWGFAVYIPVHEKTGESKQILGFVNGVFTLEKALATALDPEQDAGYELEILNGNQLLFPLPSNAGVSLPLRLPPPLPEIAGEANIHVRERTWRIVTRPSRDSLIGRLGTMYRAARSIGLIGAFAIAALAFVSFSKREERKQARLSQERIQQSLAAGQRMESVGKLAGGVAHDFNNMLTTIMGNASMLSSEPSMRDSDRARLDQIQTACDRATALTSQLLAFDRKGSQERDRIAIAEEIPVLKPLLQALIPSGIEFEVANQAAAAWVGISPSQLAQILTNLVSNAVDASRVRGVIRVEIQLIAQGAKVRIAVIDNGDGMNPETQRRALEPFFTTKSEGHGTGLGLASVARLVEQVNGSLRIRSKLGEGSCIEVELPCVDPGEVSDHPSEPTRKPVESLHILVAEDKASVREVTQALLHELGHRSAGYGSAADARTAQREGSFDLVLTDMPMPGGSGLDLAKALRTDGFTGPIILFSGYAEDVESNTLEALGAEFLAKPFRRDSLQRALDRAMRRSR